MNGLITRNLQMECYWFQNKLNNMVQAERTSILCVKIT